MFHHSTAGFFKIHLPFIRFNIPAVTGVDTRAIVTILRSQGSTLGEIVSTPNKANTTALIEDPNSKNLVAQVSVKDKIVYNNSSQLAQTDADCGPRIALIDCGTLSVI